MTHQRTIIEEHYDTKARIQLAFISYIKIALFVCIGFALMFALFLLTVSPFEETAVSVGSMLISFLPTIFLYFIFAIMGSLLMYPVYRWWCEKHRGQLMSGKFAMIREIESEEGK